MNKTTDLTALLTAIVESQVATLEAQIRRTATDKAHEYIRDIFGKKSVSDGKGNGNFTTVNGPMLDFIQKKIDSIALSDKVHEKIESYIKENFDRVLQEELEIAIRDKARHEARKGAFSHIPNSTPVRKDLNNNSGNGLQSYPCSDECVKERL